jgi:integrase
MRWAEQYSLEWKDVDLERDQITLLVTKSGETQHVPINSPARRALLKLRASRPEAKRVCKGATYYNHFLRGFWGPVLERAKLVDFRWHDLRHTFASRLVTRGVNIFEVSKLLRHGEVKTTERYAHLGQPHLAAASERLAEPEPSVADSVQAPDSQKYLQYYQRVEAK